MLKIVLVFVCLIAAVATLSCVRCPPEMVNACPQLTCHKSERVRGQCECCEKCGQDLGEKCSEADPCYPNLVCYALDRDVSLPWFYNGICVSNRTYHELPPEPTPCVPCDQQFPNGGSVTVPQPTTAAVTTIPPLSNAQGNENRAIAKIVTWVRRHINKT